VNEKAHSLKGNNPIHEVKILNMFIVISRTCKCLGVKFEAGLD